MDDQHGRVNLPATYVGAQPKPGKDSIGGGFSDRSGRGFSPAGPAAMQPIYDHLWNQTVEKLNMTTQAVQNEYTVKLQNLPHTIENELAAVRAEGTHHALPPAAAIQRELQVRNTLLLRKTAALHVQVALAHAFYGSDPINKTTRDFLGKSKSFGRVTTPDGIASQKWESSYRAAHEAKLLSQSIQMLNQQQVDVNKWLAAVQANDQARLAAEQEARRAAAELARINEQAAAHAREQARLEALAEAQRLAVEQARIAAEAATQQAAAEQARLEAQAEIKREAEKAAKRRKRKNSLDSWQWLRCSSHGRPVALFPWPVRRRQRVRCLLWQQVVSQRVLLRPKQSGQLCKPG